MSSCCSFNQVDGKAVVHDVDDIQQPNIQATLISAMQPIDEP